MVLGITRRKPTRRRRASPRPQHKGVCNFKVRTRIAKATGEDKDRYKLGAVRVLPTRQQDKVLLQATDGSQAVCLLTAGHVGSARLVPGKALPKRQQDLGTVIELVEDQWRSSDGNSEPDPYAGENSFPSILDVLPDIKGKPFTVKPDPQSKHLPHLLLGIDLSLLTKVAHGLGDTKLSLMVPIPVRTGSGKPGDAFVNKPVMIVPASDEDKSRGIGVLMPLKPVNSTDYYNKTRQAVEDAEKTLKPKSRRGAQSA